DSTALERTALLITPVGYQASRMGKGATRIPGTLAPVDLVSGAAVAKAQSQNKIHDNMHMEQDFVPVDPIAELAMNKRIRE
ncbi:unnamed protein product, partial [Amoebophrya sp. A25]